MRVSRAMDDEQAHVLAVLPDEGLTLDRSAMWTDSNREVGAAVHPSGVFVGWIDVAWPDPGTPAAVLRSVIHLPTPLDELPRSDLCAAFRTARNERARRVRVCTVCGDSVVPGHMHDEHVCQGCAERDHGVVH